jgi:hypothetical protein
VKAGSIILHGTVFDTVCYSMDQMVKHQHPTMQIWVQTRVTPCSICGGTGTGVSPSNSVFPPQWHSTYAPNSKISFIYNLCYMIPGIDNFI